MTRASAPDDVMRKVLATNTARVGSRMLVNMGYLPTLHRCQMMRAQMIAAGEAQRQQSGPATGGPVERIADPNSGAARGCERLEQAICDLYARTAKRLGCSLEAAALVLNYTPEQIARMAA